MDVTRKQCMFQEVEQKRLLKFHYSFRRLVKDLMWTDCVVDCK